jgi:predicted ATPase/tRNA A-37 threonylcarbamoyl transferase component Bud32
VDSQLARYDVLDVVSRKDGGELVKARDRENGRIVALKIVAIDSAATRERTIHEAGLLLNARPHPGLATVRYDFSDGDRHVIVLDWVDGTDLDTVMRNRGDPGLPVKEVLDYVGQVAQALDHLHEQSPRVIHGDVKPANLVVTPAGTVVLVDFGIAQAAGAIGRAGTRGFLAPEVAEGLPLTRAADVYGLAATTVALLTGRAPDGRRPLFEGINPVEVEALTRALRRALATDPALRTSSAGELAEALRAGAQAPWVGDLTFLLMGIPGFSSLRAAKVEAVDDVVERLDDIVTSAIETNGGRLLGSMSHGYRKWAVFREAAAAVASARLLHHQIDRGHWPGGLSFAVCSAIDSGTATYRDGGYAGAPVDRLSRIQPLVPAGATVLTDATVDLIRGQIPPGYELYDLSRADGPQEQPLFGLKPPGGRSFELLDDGHQAGTSPLIWIVCSDLEAPGDDRELSERTVDRYRSVLVETGTASHGRVLTMEQGLSVLLFDTAELAVEAAVAAARSFEKSQTSPTPVRARLAIHVEPTMRQSVLGAPVTTTTCRAICRAAHVGQIVVSEPARRLLANALNSGTSLEPLGTHRLSDLARPRPIYQLTHTSLPDRFPPPRTLEVQLHNLPAQVNRFIGRGDEVRQVTEQLAGHRLCTITGAAGVGKSRLSIQVAAQLLTAFPDGTWHVDVQRLGPRDELQTLIGSAIGLADSGSGTYVGHGLQELRSTADRLFDYLRDRHALVVLDNLDGQAAAAGAVVSALLARCARITVLATCREPLAIDGESLARLRPLDLPAWDSDPDEARTTGAVRLFVDRALDVRPDLERNDAAVAVISALCRAVDGLPLAIELLAARLRRLTLTGLARAVLEGHTDQASDSGESTLLVAIRSSVDTLTEPERAVFRRLAVFSGGFTLEAATSVCSLAGKDPVDVSTVVMGLADKSLIEPDAASGGDSRYELLEVTRRFAEACLTDAHEVADAQRAHLQYFASLSEQFEIGFGGPDQAEYAGAVDTDLDNLRTACDRAESALPEVGALIAACLAQYWVLRGGISEGRALLMRALRSSPDLPPSTVARAWASHALLCCFAGDIDEAAVSSRRAWAASRAAGDQLQYARSCVALGQVALLQGSLSMALRRNRAAVSVARDAGNDSLLAMALTNLGNAENRSGAVAEARSSLEEALALRQARGDDLGLSWTHLRLGMVCASAGDATGAARQLADSLRHAESVHYAAGTILATLALADVSYLQGEMELARSRYRQARELARSTKDEATECLALGGLVHVAAARNAVDEAAEALSLQEEIGSRLGLVPAASLLRSRAMVAQLQGLASAAAAHRRGALLIYRRMDDTRGALDQVEELAMCAAGFGDTSAAQSLLAATKAIRGQVGLPEPPRTQARQDRLRGQTFNSAEAASGADRLSIGEAVSLGLRVARG